jgi:hypothetical protein
MPGRSTKRAASDDGQNKLSADKKAKSDASAKFKSPKPFSSTPKPESKAQAVDGDAHNAPPSASRKGSEGRAPSAVQGTRRHLRGLLRTLRSREREITPLRSRERSPTHDFTRHAQTPPRVSFDDEAVAETHNSDMGETEVQERDEYSTSFVDEDATLLDRDFSHTGDGEEHAALSRGRETLLLEEWRRVPRNFTLPTFHGAREEVLPFVDSLLHTFETWGIDPRAQVQFAFAQIRDRTARDWMKRNPTTDFATFRRRFVERFGSHTLRRDALRALRDIRQTGGSNQGFVAAFEHVLEELAHHDLRIGEQELLLFLQLAVCERVRDAIEWNFASVRDALNRIANLTSGQTEHAPRTQAPRSTTPGPATRAPPPVPPQPPFRRHYPSPQSGEAPRRRCHGCGAEDHLIAHCPQTRHTSPAGRVPFNNGRGHQGNGHRPKRS